MIGVWAAISLRRNGRLVQLNCGGHPTINPFLHSGREKYVYHSRQPVDDVANYLGPWSEILENDGYSPEEAKAAARQVLPDILRYDRTKPAACPPPRDKRRISGGALGPSVSALVDPPAWLGS